MLLTFYFEYGKKKKQKHLNASFTSIIYPVDIKKL